jgi:DNA adenine methylase
MNAVTRPVLRWHGGKWRLAPWIISHLPPHDIYVEPYGGAASVLLRKQRARGEVYNDLDGDVVTLFRVLRDPEAALELQRLLRLTPFARAEFMSAYDPCDDPIERARRLVARSFMAYGTTGRRKNQTGFRAKTYVRNQTGPGDFATYPEALPAIVERLRSVIIEQRDAVDLVRIHDGGGTLFYVDPPYVPETRTSWRGAHNDRCYAVEMTVEDHEELLAALVGLQGMVVLSGYPSALYDDALAGWRRVEREALADGGRKRTEVLWLNPAATLAHEQPHMFEGFGDV